MHSDTILKNSRKLILEKVIQKKLPNRYPKVIEELKFSQFESILCNAVLRIELVARPWYWRPSELLFASISSLFCVLVCSKLSNYTVGDFQIGIITSLKWTRSNITPLNFLKRLFFLFSVRGSCRIFRLGIYRFLKNCDFSSDTFIEKFAVFYNGPQDKGHFCIPYKEILQVLIEKDLLLCDMGKICKTRNTVLVQSLKRKKEIQLIETLNEIVNVRLAKIRSVIKDGNKLCAVLILCSKTQRRVIYSGIYGTVVGHVPVLETRRPVGSIIKIALYSAYFEKFSKPMTTEFEDCPLTIRWRDKLIMVRNADNRFRGKVTLEYAFANSINTIALQVIQKMGVRTFANYLRKCGIHEPLPNTPLLALGPLKLTGWEVLATLSPILYSGHIVWLNGKQNQSYMPYNNGERIISTCTADTIRQLLRSTVTVGTGKYIGVYRPNAEGGKTGTSENNTDLWFVGLVNSDLYGLVWLGMSDEQSIQELDNYAPSASRFAVPLWSDLLGLDWNELA